MSNFRIIDLTHTMIPGEEQYTVELKQRNERTTPSGDIMKDVYMWSHSGTHVEVSLHFYENGKDTADFPPETFVGPAIRLDFRHKATNEPITLADFQQAGDIREGDIVILWEGREHQYRTPQSHDRPYVTEEAARWLALEKKIKLLGTDSSGFEVRSNVCATWVKFPTSASSLSGCRCRSRGWTPRRFERLRLKSKG
jgi:arylformamidase